MEKQERHSCFYQNRLCEYFPCHKGVDEADFNCLFCYCPLYALGRKCGGNYHYNEKGDKDCSACVFPHRRENYDRVLARYRDIMDVVRRIDGE
ncbi:MAG: cysteine-rich small domain-containing protein [Clostridiales bacterium]|nr:cysteine-rich small domain-containing protein [Clostridiales bacterium]MDO4350391.1 cysteine-rich small domain-containing protein [Eubacteriales bacterium]MDY4008270.1 cysteine-rich small domain-containing protein [Candidatus Limiplasma sp.]